MKSVSEFECDAVLLKLKDESRFICGATSFGVPAGKIVELRQTDPRTKQVLLNFGHGMLDWFPESVLARFEALVN